MEVEVISLDFLFSKKQDSRLIMLRNLTKPTRCIAFHMNTRLTTCEKYASNNINPKIASKQQVLTSNYATAAAALNGKSILWKILSCYISSQLLRSLFSFCLNREPRSQVRRKTAILGCPSHNTNGLNLHSCCCRN